MMVNVTGCDAGHGPRGLMWCTSCGPMGVSPDAHDAKMIALRHLESHGCDVITMGDHS